MKAIVFRKYGGPEVLEQTELPRPTPGPGQILVRVRKSSINPIDWKIASGKIRLVWPAKFPQVPGFDIAGEVVETGPGVSGFAGGARVHARLADKTGAVAEYTLATPEVTALIPEGMDDTTAAGLPLAGMTALQGLRNHSGMPMQGARQRVLVLGASGGVGHLAVQLARAAGATVIGVCSARNRELVTGLGAHEILDYTQPDAYRGMAPCDIVLDCVGAAAGPWLSRLNPGGHFATILPSPGAFLRSALNPLGSRKVHAVLLKASAADLSTLDELVTAGKLKLVVDSHFPMAELRAAWERSISGRAVGKIMIDIP